MRKIVAGVVLALVSGPALAGQPCKDIDPRVDAEGTSCIVVDYKQADRELNKIYRERLRLPRAPEKEEIAARAHLVKAQRLWNKFVEEDCASVEAAYGEAAGRLTASLLCVTDHMRQRTAALKKSY